MINTVLITGASQGIGKATALKFAQNGYGTYYMGSVEQASLEDWQHVIQTNVWGYIHRVNALFHSALLEVPEYDSFK